MEQQFEKLGFTHPQLQVTPQFSLLFNCIEMGCDEVRTISITNKGAGVMGVSQLALMGNATDFQESITHYSNTEFNTIYTIDAPTAAAPILIKSQETIYVQIRYQPQDAIEDHDRLMIDWFDAANPYDAQVIHHDSLPIRTAQLDLAKAQQITHTLNLGYVPVGNTATGMIDIANISTTRAVLGVTQAEWLTPHDQAFAFDVGWSPTANANQVIHIPVRFTPQTNAAAFAEARISLHGQDDMFVKVKATAIAHPDVKILEPENQQLNLGNITLGQTVSRTIQVMNRGGQASQLRLSVNSSALSIDYAFPEGRIIKPMEEVPVVIQIQPNQGGYISAPLHLSFRAILEDGTVINNITGGTAELNISGVCLAPEISASQYNYDVGEIVNDWHQALTPLKLSNVGSGPLHIYHVYFDEGSAPQFRFNQPEALPKGYIAPLVIPEGGSWLLHFYPVRSSETGIFTAQLVIESNSIIQPQMVIPFTLETKTCEQLCTPPPHGDFNCQYGSCAISKCHNGWSDIDNKYSNGCECQTEPYHNNKDIGQYCGQHHDAGAIGDDCRDKIDIPYSTKDIRGTLNGEHDIDYIHFKAQDAGGIFCDWSDSFDLRVQLVNTDPRIFFRIRTDPIDSGSRSFCAEPANWGALLRAYNYNAAGSGSEDSQSVTVAVQFKPGVGPVCMDYTLRINAFKD